MFAVGAVALSPALGSAQPTRIPRIGFLTPNSYTANASPRAAFIERLRDEGFIVGKTAFLDLRFGDGDVNRLPQLAAELVQQKVDVIFVASAAGAVAAKKATNEIPIVFMSVYDPVRAGLVASLAHPGGNMTGISNLSREVARKRTQLLSELSPGSAQVGVLASPSEETVAILEEMQGASATLAVQLHIEHVAGREDFERAFLNIRKAGIRVVMPVPHPLFYTNRKRLVDLAAQNRLLLMGWTREFAEAGAPVSYGASNEDMARLGAEYVARILKGDRPANLPVQIAGLELVINRRSAKAMGFTMPASLLVRADKLID